MNVRVLINKDGIHLTFPSGRIAHLVQSVVKEPENEGEEGFIDTKVLWEGHPSILEEEFAFSILRLATEKYIEETGGGQITTIRKKDITPV